MVGTQRNVDLASLFTRKTVGLAFPAQSHDEISGAIVNTFLHGLAPPDLI
jgi:hypothetical protein